MPLVIPDTGEASALRLDALMHGIALAYLVGETNIFCESNYRIYCSQWHDEGFISLARIPIHR